MENIENKIVVTTIDNVPGKQIVTHYGLVKGSSVRAKHVGRDFMASLKSVVGGELSGYQELLSDARDTALERLQAEAEALGANAVINVRMTTSSIVQGASEVLCYGTAVQVE